MDLADFVPPAMLPMPMQNANSSLSQRVSRLSAARRDRDNPEPGIIWVFKRQSSAVVVIVRKDRPKSLGWDDVRWQQLH
jgi:hypothetical protein